MFLSRLIYLPVARTRPAFQRGPAHLHWVCPTRPCFKVSRPLRSSEFKCCSAGFEAEFCPMVNFHEVSAVDFRALYQFSFSRAGIWALTVFSVSQYCGDKSVSVSSWICGWFFFKPRSFGQKVLFCFSCSKAEWRKSAFVLRSLTKK